MKRACAWFVVALTLALGLWCLAAFGLSSHTSALGPRPVQAWAANPAANLGLSLKAELATLTPTVTPSVIGVVTSTLGDWRASDPDDCLKVNDVVHESRVSVMYLVYRGTPSSAKLYVTFCNSDDPHPIYLNGVQVGTAPTFSTENCECNATPGLGYATSFDIDPSLLAAAPGYANLISTTNALYPWDTFKVYHTYLVVTGDVTGASRSYFAIGTNEDGAPLFGGMQLPMDYNPAAAHPLLVVVPGTGEDKDDGLNLYALRANEVGWLLASLDLRWISAFNDESMRTPSLAVQYDVMALVHYIQHNYPVDASRIYIAGFSTGGGIAATVAARYPDVFAGVLDYAGPTDYAEWYYERADLQGTLARQFWGWPDDYFEYPRRSSRALARNLQYVPMRIVHGTADDRVAFSQSSRLYNEAMPPFYDPASTHKEFLSHPGGHENYVAGVSETDLPFLAQHTLVTNPQHVQLIIDEAKDYYWLHVDKSETAADEWGGWVELDARYDPGTNIVWVTAKDGAFAEGKPLTVTLNLARMGLPAASPYDIDEYDDATGERWIHTVVSPVGGILVWVVPRNALGAVNRRYVITLSDTVNPTPTPTVSPTSAVSPTRTRTLTPSPTASLVPTATPTRTPPPARTVYVTLNPSSTAVARDQLFTVDIQIVAGAQLVDAAQIFLYFDQTHLQVVDSDAGMPGVQIEDLSYGQFRWAVITNTVHTEGAPAWILFSSGYLTSGTKPSGTFSLARIHFKALMVTAGGSTPLEFGTAGDRKTEILYGGHSVLAGVQNGSVTISGETPSATPTPTLTATPTRTLTPTATRTATPRATVTPTPIPTPPPEDLDGDCDVDGVDIALVSNHWDTRVGDARYVQRYDLDNDGDIDIVDVMRVVAHWGERCAS